MRWQATIGLVLSLAATVAQGQTCRWVPLSHAPTVLDSVPIAPHSISVAWLSAKDWSFHAPDNTLRFHHLPTGLDSVMLCYQTVAQVLTQPYQLHTYREYDSSALFISPASFPSSTLTQQVFGSEGGLTPNGYLSRSLAVGNQQNVFFNSRFQLEVSGNISEDLTLSAELRDSQLPFQPEGNTQQLRQFDRVYLEVAHREGLRVGAGDLNLAPLPGRFLQYRKQAMGLMAAYETKATQAQVAVGQGRGQFVSTWLTPEEAVAGPYRLYGQHGEAFIQLLAGSERVYLDEQLLIRGEDQDYTIDYNLAELTFTPRITITRTSRIRVEYEYAVRSYPRQTLHAQASHTLGAWQVWGQTYRQKDNPLRPNFFTLTQDLALGLSTIPGGQPALIPSGDSVGFAPQTLRYARRDSLLEGQNISYYVYSTVPEEALWQVRFTHVGDRAGDYVLAQNLPQGRVYQWVPPQNGESQGNYAPVVEIPLPTQQQMVSGGVNYQADGHQLSVELAASGQNHNLYRADGEEWAGAAWLTYSSPQKTWLGYQWQSAVNLESKQSDFNPIERYQAVDFSRFWQGSDSLVGPWDHWGQLRVEGATAQGNRLWMEQGGRYAGIQVGGWQQALGADQTWARWQLSGASRWLAGHTGPQNNRWQQHQWTLLRQGRYLTPGYRYQAEQQQYRHAQSDSLLGSVQYWQQHAFFLRSGDSLQGQWELGYQWREEQAPLEAQMTPSATAQLIYLRWVAPATETFSFTGTGQYRWLQTPEQAPQQYLNGQLRLHWQPWAGTRLHGNWSTQTSRELQREFVYLPVPLGQGTHTWRDLNGDGQQSLNEFVEAIYFNERQYARFYVPTQNYLPAQSHHGRASLSLQAPEGWRSGATWQKTLARLSASATWEHRQRTALGATPQRLSSTSQTSVTGFWNRHLALWGLEGGYHAYQSQQLLTQGTEASYREGYYAKGRWQPRPRLNLSTTLEQGLQGREAPFWEGQSWEYQYQKVTPEIQYQGTQHWRFSSLYRWEQREATGQPLRAQIQEIEVKGQFQTMKPQQQVSGQLSYLTLDYDGTDTQGPLAYQLLEGLRPGHNWIFRIDWQQQLPSGLQLTLFYEGRTGTNRWLHAGNAQVAWIF